MGTTEIKFDIQNQDSVTFHVEDTLVRIDSADFAKVKDFRWHVKRNCMGRKSIFTRMKINGKWRQVTLGSLLLNPSLQKGTFVYLRNRCEILDYRKENLFAGCLKFCKQISPPIKSDKSSRFKGVCYDKIAKRWRAAIACNGRSYFIGLYGTEEDAARAYDQAAAERFGPHAYQNLAKKRSV